MMKNFRIRRLIFGSSLIIAISSILTSCSYHNVMVGDAITFSDDAETSYQHEKKLFGLIKNQSHPITIYGSTKKFNKERDAASALATLNDNEYYKLKSQIWDIPQGENTAGLYALDLGLDRVRYVRNKILKRDRNTKFYIVYLTDGLDNISLQVARNNKQTYARNLDKYKKKIDRKKKNIMGILRREQQCFQIFPMAFVGKDLQEIQKENNLTDSDFEKYLRDELNIFRGSSKGWETPEVLLAKDWEELQEKFQNIFASASYNFYVPKGYLGHEIRMTLTSDDYDSIVLTGMYRKNFLGKHFLENVNLNAYTNEGNEANIGINLKNEITNTIDKIIATNFRDKKSTISWFSLPNIIKDEKNLKILSAKQHYQNGTIWSYNSEYDSKAKAMANTYFLFIADGSKSLGNQRKGEEEMLSTLLETIKNTFIYVQE